MGKLIRRSLNSIKGVHWPTRKEVIFDTLLTVCTTAVLAVMVGAWTHAIEYIVDLVVSLF
jgi:preprotein translocase SecE subunit